MDLTKRQIEYPFDTYQRAIDAMSEENRRRGLIGGKDKLYIKHMLVTLVADGAKARKGKMYVPDDLIENLDPETQLAIGMAENAIEYANKLIYKL